MGAKVLYVDDDVSLLKVLQRNMFKDYDLRIAESGPAALDLLGRESDFSVVVTDMRMPEMDGLQFIKKAREIAGESVYVMLTGNQDAATATGAINKGQVFRYLTKPCTMGDMRSAIDDAVRHYQVLSADRQMLEKTFVGAVAMLTDVVESLCPETTQLAQRVDEVMKACEAALGGTGSWEFRLAARLGLVGFVLLPKEDQARFLRLPPNDPQNNVLLERFATTSAHLLDRLPRLKRVSRIIEQLPSADGSIFATRPYDFADTALGAALLRIAIHWNAMMLNGMSPGVAVKLLERAVSAIPGTVVTALASFAAPTRGNRQLRIALAELAEGMILREDAVAIDGAVLLRQGRELTATMIEKLSMHYSNSDEPALFLVEKPSR